jgi:hypothetical protein
MRKTLFKSAIASTLPLDKNHLHPLPNPGVIAPVSNRRNNPPRNLVAPYRMIPVE